MEGQRGARRATTARAAVRRASRRPTTSPGARTRSTPGPSRGTVTFPPGESNSRGTPFEGSRGVDRPRGGRNHRTRRRPRAIGSRTSRMGARRMTMRCMLGWGSERAGTTSGRRCWRLSSRAEESLGEVGETVQRRGLPPTRFRSPVERRWSRQHFWRTTRRHRSGEGRAFADCPLSQGRDGRRRWRNRGG